MFILYLDFDGVTIPDGKEPEHCTEEALAVLRAETRGDCGIVVSSMWRLDTSEEELKGMLRGWGLGHIPFLGVTGPHTGSRADEILTDWAQRGRPEATVIDDDMSVRALIPYGMRVIWVRSSYKGLRWVDVPQARGEKC